MTRLAALLLLLGTLVLAAAPVAFAASSCGGVVQDGDDLLTAAEEEEVLAAAERLAAAGVRPLVVVTSTLSGTDAEAALEAIVEGCAGLTDGSGEWGANVLAVLVAPEDRETAIHEGGGLPALDVTETDVDLDVMNPRFAEGDLAGGLVAGLDRMAAIQQAEVDEATTADGSTDSGGWFAGGVGATVLAGGGAALAARARTARRRREESHARAVEAQADVAQTILDMERDVDVAALDANALADRLALVEATPLRQQLTTVRGTVQSVVTRWYALTQQVDATPSGDPITYDRVAGEIAELAPTATHARELVAGFATDVAALVAMEEGIPGRLDALGGRHEAARSAIADAQQRGYRTDPAEADLSVSIAALGRARDAHGQRLVRGADEHLDLAEAAVTEAIEWVEGIEEMRAALAEDLSSLRSRRQVLEDRVGPAGTTMESLEARWATAAWEDVAGNGSEAEAELARAADALQAAEHAQLMDVQDWDEAHDALDAAEDDLDDAAALLDAIHARDAALQEAADLAPSTIAGATAAVDEAAGFARQHSADVSDPIESRIVQLSSRVGQVEAAMAEDRPNPAAAVAAAGQVQAEVAELLATARQEVTAADMARRRAEQTVASARQELQQLQRYATGHRRYVAVGSARALQDIGDRLARLDAVADPVQRETQAAGLQREIIGLSDDIRRSVRRATAPRPSPYGPGRGGGYGGGLGGVFGTGGPRRSSGGFGGGFGGGSSSRGSSSRSRTGSSSRSRSGSSSRSRSSSGRSRSGRSSRW